MFNVINPKNLNVDRCQWIKDDDHDVCKYINLQGALSIYVAVEVALREVIYYKHYDKQE